MKHSGFDWDDGNWPKCGKHGLTKADIEAAFGENLRIAPDLKHSVGERRYIAVSRDSNGRPFFVGFTLRRMDERLLIRPVTARYMHEKEARRYETQSPGHDDR